MTLTVLSYNTLFGGREGVRDDRAQSQAELIGAIQPDIFLMQEATGFEANGGSWLYELEMAIGMRGFLARAETTGQNTAVFIRPTIAPVAFTPDAAHFHHALAQLVVALPTGHLLTVMSAHLCPNGPEVRRREATYLAPLASPDSFSLIAGDFNSASPHDLAPVDFQELPAHHRTRYAAPSGEVDTSVLSLLEAAGWVDVAFHLDTEGGPTVPTAGFTGTEFPTMRCDYLLATKELAQTAAHYEVIKTPATDRASDHYPILARFEI